ncbi:hypothetical protein P5P86_00240 [Nocardioides sp. BP30]|uniref:hypothetical protein n=1 Tax=Nocardioides sp. BP30 TaxID=3036374 RepID=UPI002469AFF8|nr:hypothetical protein [Nocardioides sp. BP30]WGL52275.1 hypothetical protein P5P86_00240 [Nocardioides sp. BP30]
MAEIGPSPQTPPRPQQVTYAGWAVVLGSIALVISAFEQISTLHSLDTRMRVTRMVAEMPDRLGVTVEGLLTTFKVLGMVSGACAAAAAILGWQALQRSRSARIALLVLVVPLVLAGLPTGWPFAVMVGVAVMVLWLPVANAWFDPRQQGRMQVMSETSPPAIPGPPAGLAGSDGPAVGAGQHPQPPAPPASSPQPPPYGAYPPPQQPYPRPPQQPYAPYATYGAPDPDARPGSVTAAAVITMILSGLTAFVGLILAIIGGVASDDVMWDLSDRGYDTGDFTLHDLVVVLMVMGIVMVVAGVAAIVVAVFVLRRSATARIVLTVLSGLTIALSLVSIASIVAVLPLAGAITTIVLLFGRRASDWFARRGGLPPYPPVHPGGPWPPTA